MNLNPSRLIAVAALAIAASAFAVPVVSDISVTPGSTAGGGVMYISGTGFGISPIVTVGSTTAPIQSATPTLIRCTVPSGVGSGIPVVVIDPGTSSSSTPVLANPYDIPRISSLSQTTSSTIGGSVLTILGSNFGPDASNNVRIGDFSAISAPGGINNHTRIQVLIPPGRGSVLPVKIQVGNQTNFETHQFSYNPPFATSVQNDGFTTAGGLATIFGSNFGPTPPTVYLNNTPVTVNLAGTNHNAISFNMPPGAGTGFLLVSAGNQASNTRLISYPSPFISGITPTSASTDGNTQITIIGTNLGDKSTASITFNGQSLSPLPSSPGHTSLHFTLPPGQGVARSLQVNVGGQASNILTAFSYNSPVINQVIPPQIDIAGQLITIRGTNFGQSASVIINGLNAPVTSQAGSIIICQAPQGAAPGPANISVVVQGQISNNFQASYTCPADFNDDGSVDFFDYLDFVAAFSTPC